MKFLRVQCKGSVNSFRQPDFYTYHKTLPLPPKTTVAGMLGSALGLSPIAVNKDWIIPQRFKMGIVGKNNGKADDLWQIRKYETKQIDAFKKGAVDAPYKTAVIVRELLIGCDFIIYLNFDDIDDFEIIENGLSNPKWAISLGREDELIKITQIDSMELPEIEELELANTVVCGNIDQKKYEIRVDYFNAGNLLNQAPSIVKLPVQFDYDVETEVRVPSKFEEFSFVHDLPIKLKEKGFRDEELQLDFQIF